MLEKGHDAVICLGEYGAGQLTSSNSDSNPNLNYSQAVLLLGIPKEERAQFILDMDIEGMTNQELKQAVNERTHTRQEKDQVLQEKTWPCRKTQISRKQWKTNG